MKFLYDDESFSFEALRATGFADYGGAELGEVLATCRQIRKGMRMPGRPSGPRQQSASSGPACYLVTYS
jgi:hypothetical protein